MNKYDLLERTVNFVMKVDQVIQKIPETLLMKNLSSQLIRSSSSVALNYSEAISAESHNDFIHKLRIVIKELRETHTGLLIIYRKYPEKPVQGLETAIEENDELLAIFSRSVQTAEKNRAIMKQQAKSLKGK